MNLNKPLGIFGLFIFSVLFIKMAEAAPINETASNITSNLDLNLSVSEVSFLNGSLVFAKLNSSSNLSAWDTWSDGDFVKNPFWNLSNATNPSTVWYETKINDKSLTISLKADASSSTIEAQTVHHGMNLTFSDPDGITITSIWNLTSFFCVGAGQHARTAMGFNPNWDNFTNTSQVLYDLNTTDAIWVHFWVGNSDNCQFQLISKNEGSFGSGWTTLASGSLFNNDTRPNSTQVSLWLNSTHAQAWLNYSLDGSKKLGDLAAHTCDECKSGGKVFFELEDSSGSGAYNHTVRFDNFMAYNGTPSNLTSARFESSINISFNSRDFKINLTPNGNILGSYAFFVYNYTFSSLKSITVDGFNYLGDFLAGWGINGTVTPPNKYSADEFSSILVEYNVSFAQPIIRNLTLNTSTTEPTSDVLSLFNFTDSDNISMAYNLTQWFKNASLQVSLDNNESIKSSNFSLGDAWNVSKLVNDGIFNSSWVNYSFSISDTSLPIFIGNRSNQTSETVQSAFSIFINVSDTGTNLSTVTAEFEDANGGRSNQTMNNNTLNSAGVPIQFSTSYTPALVGGLGIRFFATDFAGNTNTTVDRYLNLTINAAGSGDSGGGGGGGGGGCDAGFTNVNGTCIPTSNVTANLTRAPRCGDTFCDAFAGEDIFSCPIDCPLNKIKASYLTCSDPTQPCFFKTQKTVAYTIGFIIGGGVLFLSVNKGGKGKDAVEKAKNWLRRKGLWRG